MTDTSQHEITRDDFNKVDLAALDLAIELTLAEDDDADRVKQVRDKLIDEGWWSAASFCSYHRQIEHLSLSPNEETPCNIDPAEIADIIKRGATNNNSYGAAKLLKKMLKAGVSKYDPCPIDALARAKR